MQRSNVILGGLVSALLFQVSVLSRSVPQREGGEFGINGLTYLGSVDGKSFFYEKYPGRTWFEASNFCNDSNMRLASITSVNQANFLNGVSNMQNYTDNFFWTDGRDSQTVSQFAWGVNNSTASSEGLDFRLFIETVQTCLCFVPRLDTKGLLLARLCIDKTGTLCEIYHIH